jgi:hypothetical protein
LLVTGKAPTRTRLQAGFAGDVCFQETAKLNSMADMRRKADIFDGRRKLLLRVMGVNSAGGERTSAKGSSSVIPHRY